MDWHSRRMLSWDISTTMDAVFCVAALERALGLHPVSKTFNSDQGIYPNAYETFYKAYRGIAEYKSAIQLSNQRGPALLLARRHWANLRARVVY